MSARWNNGAEDVPIPFGQRDTDQTQKEVETAFGEVLNSSQKLHHLPADLGQKTHDEGIEDGI